MNTIPINSTGTTHPLARLCSVVIPVYNEEEVIPELVDRLQAAWERVPEVHWQVIFVDDGSRDRSAELIQQRAVQDPRIALVRLSRNFGHQAAITAGLNHVEAEAVIIMDADLQDPPEVLPDLVREWLAGGQVVIAQRLSRKDRGWRGLAFRLYHASIHWVNDFKITSQAGIFGLIAQPALGHIVQLTEHNRFLPGLRDWVGFERRIVHYHRDERAAGTPKQSFKNLLRYALDGIFSFSYKPLRLLVYIGLASLLSGTGLALVRIIQASAGQVWNGIDGISLLSALLIFQGVQLMALGVISQYLARICDEVRARPMFLVKETLGLRSAQVDTHRKAA